MSNFGPTAKYIFREYPEQYEKYQKYLQDNANLDVVIQSIRKEGGQTQKLIQKLIELKNSQPSIVIERKEEDNKTNESAIKFENIFKAYHNDLFKEVRMTNILLLKLIGQSGSKVGQIDEINNKIEEYQKDLLI